MRLVKYFVLAVVVVLGLSALATPAAAQGSNNSRNAADRIEIGGFFGGAIGHQFGGPSSRCTALVARFVLDGCNTLRALGDRGAAPGGIFPGEGGDFLKNFLATGSVNPENGPLFGFRFGVDINPTWQVEFIYSYSRVDMAFTNLDQFLEFQRTFSNAGFGGAPSTLINPDGQPQGNQQMYLFNVNYHFGDSKRVVPYVGGGAGWVKWYNGPAAFVTINKRANFGLNPRLAQFSKSSGEDTAFAVNLAGGVKIHATRHFGIRIEVMNLVSFPRFDHQFRTIDVSGQCGLTATAGPTCRTLGDTPGSLVDLSGSLRQKAEFNQLIFTAGVFWRFGGH